VRPFTLAALAVLLAACAEEGELVPVVGPAPAALTQPPRDAQRGCFPQTLGLLQQADAELVRGAAADAKRSLRASDTTFVSEDHARTCPVDAYERVQARRLLLHGLAARAGHETDVDVLLALGDAAFDPDDCKDELTARCAEHATWLAERFPNFVQGDAIRVGPLFRLPYTPQPNGRFTVEYLEVMQRRIDALPGDAFALSLEPSGTTTVDAEPLGSLLDLHVDGADVVEEHKAGAHLTARVPSDDLLRVHGSKSFVVVLNRKTLARSGSGWRATDARVAFGED
jgi:hypothetical protein